MINILKILEKIYTYYIPNLLDPNVSSIESRIYDYYKLAILYATIVVLFSKIINNPNNLWIFFNYESPFSIYIYINL